MTLAEKLSKLRSDYRQYPNRRDTITLQARVLIAGIKYGRKNRKETKPVAQNDRLLRDVKESLF